MVQVHHRPTRVQRLLCWVLVSQLASVSAFAPLGLTEREACHRFTATPDLSKCPGGTVYVSARDPKAKFRTIQQALNNLKATGANISATILIGSGQYQEQVVVDGFKSVTLMGQITTSRSPYTGNTVEITHNRALQKSDGYDNWNTATLLVKGCTEFRSYNLNVRQTAPSGIALAVAVMSSSAGFYATAMSGHQDTLFFGPGFTRGYLYGCSIAGVVDFLYGWSPLVVVHSKLVLLSQGTAFVAWRGEESATSGVYFFYTSFDKVENPSTKIYDGSVAVGRPWDPQARMVMYECYLGSVILPAVFVPWAAPKDARLSQSTFLAEYGSQGPGAKGQRKLVTSANRKVDSEHLSYLLDEKTASSYSIGSIFPDGTSWIDFNFDVKAGEFGSGGGGGSSTPGALAKAPALAASLPPVPASKASPTPSGGKGTPLTPQGPKKTTQDPKKTTQDPKKTTQDPKKTTQDPKKTEHDPTKQKSKHHSDHKSKRKKKTTSTKPQVGSGAAASSSHVSGGGLSLASLPKKRGHGSRAHHHRHHYSRRGRKHHH